MTNQATRPAARAASNIARMITKGFLLRLRDETNLDICSYIVTYFSRESKTSDSLELISSTRVFISSSPMIMARESSMFFLWGAKNSVKSFRSFSVFRVLAISLG